VAAVALLLVAGVVQLVQGTRGPAGVPAQDVPGAVLLVPGYGGGRDALGGLAQRLRRSGREATVLTLPGDGTGDLTAQAAALQDAVQRALQRGAPSVDVIGYSAGGVVARLWVANYDGAHSARRVVTLGSPLHGARLAGVGSVLVPGACPPACRQLAPGSALLRSLEATPVPTGLPWLSVWTEDDRTVVPPDSARLTGAVNVAVQSVCPDAQVSHGQLPTDPLVTGLVLRALGPGPSPAGDVPCGVLQAEARRSARGTGRSTPASAAWAGTPAPSPRRRG